MLTKIPGDNDVIAAALTSGVIMRVVWGQHGSLRSCEMSSTRSCWERIGNSRQNRRETNSNQPPDCTRDRNEQSEDFHRHDRGVSAFMSQNEKVITVPTRTEQYACEMQISVSQFHHEQQFGETAAESRKSFP